MRHIPAGSQIGPLVRGLRVTRGWNQAELARAAGIPQATLSNYENGKRELPLGSAIRLAASLDVTLAELVDVESEAKPDRQGVHKRDPSKSTLSFQVSDRLMEIAVLGGSLTKSEIGLIKDYLTNYERVAPPRAGRDVGQLMRLARGR
jgi:transcriptional regulator with XRE-family HTH domain